MRLLAIVAFSATVEVVLLGQGFTISTIAGGGLPENIKGVAASSLTG